MSNWESKVIISKTGMFPFRWHWEYIQKEPEYFHASGDALTENRAVNKAAQTIRTMKTYNGDNLSKPTS